MYVTSDLLELQYETTGKVCWESKANYETIVESERNVGTFAGWSQSQTIYVSGAQDNFIFVADRALAYVNPYSDYLKGYDLDCNATVVYNYDLTKVPDYKSK